MGPEVLKYTLKHHPADAQRMVEELIPVVRTFGWGFMGKQ